MPSSNPTTGLGVAAKLAVAGNEGSGKSTVVRLSLSNSNGYPSTFQLNPNIEDAAGNEFVTPTSFVLSQVAASSPGTLTLASVANASGGSSVYTGTITGGASNAFAGINFVVAGFDNAANNGTFECTASSGTTLTLSNAAGVADTHAATATGNTGTAVYTGTITGGGTNAFAGNEFVVTGFTNAANNGTFIATASSATTLTLDNPATVAETHAAAADNQTPGTPVLTYVAYGSKNASGAVASVSATGLITALHLGNTTVEVSFPTFDNAVGNVASTGNIMNGLPINKIFRDVSVYVKL